MSLKDCFARKWSKKKTRWSRIFRNHIICKTDQLPSKVDLRPDMTPIVDQLNIGSSIANALAGAYEYLVKKSNGHDLEVSRLFIYYNARVRAHGPNVIVDCGCSMTDAIEALEQFGTCLESIWPYNLSRVNTHPSSYAYEQAKNHRINKAMKLNVNLNEMKSCLAQGFPFAFSLKIYPSFEKAMKNGIVPVPIEWEDDEESIGSHTMLAVGYSDRSDAFIVRNSWSQHWGDNGYCYIPYEYMTNRELCSDIWTIRKVENTDFGREYWHFDDMIDYLTIDYRDHNEQDDDNDDKESVEWKDYFYNRKSYSDDSWFCYRMDSIKNNENDEYLYRQNRYDRDNDRYDQHYGGYTTNTQYSSRNYSSPFNDRYQEENSYGMYYNFDDDRWNMSNHW